MKLVKLVYRRTLLLLVVATMLLLGACSKGEETVEKIHLFSLDIGRMEDQLDLVQYPGKPFKNEFHLVIQNGMVSISDAVSRKIMKFNSYGDLVLLIYNPETNPEPVLLSTGDSEGTVTSKLALEYQFLRVGTMAIAPTGVLYAVDYVPVTLESYDTESRARLRSHVLKFAENGEYLLSIGQEGVDGTPFPFVMDTFVTDDRKLVVVSRSATDWQIFAYDEHETPIYSLRVQPDELPLADGATVASLTKVVPADDMLIYKVDYFGGDMDDLEFSGSSLIFYDPGQDTIVRTVELPGVQRNRRRSQLVGSKNDEVMYELLGAAANGYAYCIAPVDESVFRMLILSPTGDSVYAGTIELEDDQALLRTFYVSSEGILAALVAEPLSSHIYLWRYDRVLREVLNETR